MILHQQTPNCSDFDVTLDGDGSPSFRMLLPEHVRAEGFAHAGVFHVIPGDWRTEPGFAEGRFTVDDVLDISVSVVPRSVEAGICLTLANVGSRALRNVTADVCASVNHLPGRPVWCNRRFMREGVPLDRDAQGRCWYQEVTPQRLHALTDVGWVGMHPHPDAPDADTVPLYGFLPSRRADACACAVESVLPSETVQFYQAWDAPCRYCTPCPGNACMHLVALVAEELDPGASATVHGRIGVHVGDRASLAAYLTPG